MIGKLSSQERVHWYLGTGSWDLNAALTTFDEEDTDLITRYGKIDLVPFAIVVSFPGDKNTLVGQSSCGVFEGSKLGLTT